MDTSARLHLLAAACFLVAAVAFYVPSSEQEGWRRLLPSLLLVIAAFMQGALAFA